MQLLNPHHYQGDQAEPSTNEMLQAVIDFLEKKGLKSIKKDWHEKIEICRKCEVMRAFL